MDPRDDYDDEPWRARHLRPNRKKALNAFAAFFATMALCVASLGAWLMLRR
jgi:hypothetical protein